MKGEEFKMTGDLLHATGNNPRAVNRNMLGVGETTETARAISASPTFRTIGTHDAHANAADQIRGIEKGGECTPIQRPTTDAVVRGIGGARRCTPIQRPNIGMQCVSGGKGCQKIQDAQKHLTSGVGKSRARGGGQQAKRRRKSLRRRLRLQHRRSLK